MQGNTPWWNWGALALTPGYNQWDNSIGPTHVGGAEDYSSSVMLYFELESYFYRL